MSRRLCSHIISSPLAALALLLLLSCSLLHRAAAARPLRAVAPPLAHQVAENSAKAAAAADGLVLLQNGAVVSGDDVLSVSESEMKGAETEEEGEESVVMASCEEANDDECLQRRLLRDAHLDYIYTQHKGNKP